MSNLSVPYIEAQRLIAHAKANESDTLRLNTRETRFLKHLPLEIGGLEHLRTLIINDTQITDLSPLANLDHLNTLQLGGSLISDISPLASLTHLKILSIGSALIEDFSVIADLRMLTTLRFRHTPIADLTPLSSLGLTTLSLNDTPVSDFSLLASFSELRHLSVNGSLIPDLSSLAGLTNLTTLSLDRTNIIDLTPISSLVQMEYLSLRATKITNLSPIRNMRELVDLSLVNSEALDLRPLRKLTKLVDGPFNRPHSGGLEFQNTAASRADPRIAEISEIEDPATRARELFAYLEDWQPPIPADSPLVPAYNVPENGPITSVEAPPEEGDEDQEDLRQDLIRKTSILIEAIGSSNEMATLKGAAEHYQRQINKPLKQIRLSLLYSAANSLRTGYEADLRAEQLARYSDMLPPPVAAPLKDLVETHSLFFMGFPNAADLHLSMLAGLTGDRNRSQVDLAEPLVRAFEGRPHVLATEDQQALADDLAAAKGKGASAEIAEKRLIARLWNIFGAVGRTTYAASRAGALIIISSDIPAWLLGNQTVIGAFLKAAQGAGARWFDIVAQFLMRL